MRKSWLPIIAFFLLSAAPVRAAGDEHTPPATSQPDDAQVIAVMELLELMDLVQEIDLLKEMHYLIEGDPDENDK